MRHAYDEDEFGTQLSQEIMGYGRELLTNLVKQYPDTPVREISNALRDAIASQAALEIGNRFKAKVEAA